MLEHIILGGDGVNNLTEEIIETNIIEYKGTKYEMFIENNNICLKYWDEEYKSWIILEFAGREDDSAEKYIIDTLSKQFLERITSIK